MYMEVTALRITCFLIIIWSIVILPLLQHLLKAYPPLTGGYPVPFYTNNPIISILIRLLMRNSLTRHPEISTFFPDLRQLIKGKICHNTALSMILTEGEDQSGQVMT